MKNRRITIQDARAILGKDAEGLTDMEISVVLDSLYEFAVFLVNEK